MKNAQVRTKVSNTSKKSPIKAVTKNIASHRDECIGLISRQNMCDVNVQCELERVSYQETYIIGKIRIRGSQ